MLTTAADADAAGCLAVLIEMGVFDAGDPPDPADALAWLRAWTADFTDPQPFTHTPETAAAMAHALVAPVGAHGEVVRKAGVDTDYLMLTRVNLGAAFVLGTLRATAPWAAIRREWDENGPAASELGELDQAFWADRADAVQWEESL